MTTLSQNLLSGWDVMIIDDEEDSLEVAEIILTEYGANVHQASNGQEALTLLKSVRPKFIISDLSMPVLDGWGFVHAVKSDVHLADIPVIALTAHAMIGDRERGIAAGFHNYLTKPLTLVDIPELAQELQLSI